MPTRVLLTGASGLLGRALFKEFEAAPAWEILGLAFSRAKRRLRKVDITNHTEVAQVMQDFKPKVVIHSAAERRPDNVEHKEAETKALNVDATTYICEEAVKNGAFVVFISTDYVFDGTSPPHKHDDKPNPLNKYGRSKLDGEEITMKTNKDNMILRLPILYGDIESLDESAITILFPPVLNSNTPCVMSDYERRHPTHCGDVAYVLRKLVERRLQDPSLTGVFQWSGDENMTKYDMAITIASVFDLQTSHIEADKKPSGGAKRPYNSHIDPSRIESLGICKRTPFKEGIQPCLLPFLNK